MEVMKVVEIAEEMERFAIGLGLQSWWSWRLLSGAGPKGERRVDDKTAATARAVKTQNAWRKINEADTDNVVHDVVDVRNRGRQETVAKANEPV